MRLLQVATFGTEGTKSAILTACRGYRSKEHPNGIDVDTAQYIAGLIPSERGFLWTLDETVNGNEEKDRKPNQTFINEVAKYPGLLDIMFGIEGLVNKRSQHASGVIIYNENPWKTGAVMRSPNGDLITQFSLHEIEKMGGTKFDFLVTSVCDKIINTINLLQNDGEVEKDLTLRQFYNKYIHPSVIDIQDNVLWDTLAKGQVNSLFQFETDVGGQAIAMIKPRDPSQLMMANALTRLTGEKGQERPIERYVRLKSDMRQWYQECRKCGLTEEEIKIIEPHYLPFFGEPTTQEAAMRIAMDEKLSHYSLAEANAMRKVISKKQVKKVPEQKEKFVSQCPSRTLGEYVWKTAMEPQMSYSFAEPHALAYSYVAIQTLVLVTKFPIVYWNCACLITDSGSDEPAEQEEPQTEVVSIYEPENFEEYEYEDIPETKEKVKKKIATPDYGKVASAIGKFKSRGIDVLPPDINESSFTFTPNAEKNSITYGLRGITRVSTEIINQIIANRPYASFDEFMEKNHTNKLQTINLIKSGAFDSLEGDRVELMRHYIDSIADKKQRLTLQNMPGLIEYDCIPEEMAYYKKLFSFNKFLKKNKNGNDYILNEAAINFIANNFDADYIVNGNSIPQKTWDNLYKKAMEPMRDYLKENKDALLKELNQKLFDEEWSKYATGNISKWEMESISFYYHDHELTNHSMRLDNFFELPDEPRIEKTFTTKGGQEITMYELSLIAGTVIDKNKLKNSISLLTPDGVVNVKIYKNQYSLFDRQISVKNPDGSKTVLEKSWFQKGTLLLIQGIKRGDSYVPKHYKSSVYPVISKINEVREDGSFDLQFERIEV